MSIDVNSLIERIVKEEVEKFVESNDKVASDIVPVGVSARHVHVSQKDLEVLFGENATLTKKKELMGGQFAAEECVTLLGSKLNAIEKVRILGPVRQETQVELAKTDAIKLKINAPIRESGKISGSASITIVGPKGAINLNEGCIIAKRHIHMSPKEAAAMNVIDNDFVNIKVPGERGGIFTNVQVRVHDTYTLEMHIDTDEANAFGIKCGQHLKLIK
ncbi:phosphate propanoyltransferase [Clostridium grantii]|uniref:Phosphate propanoyltransferase n=1 Tax=Clostridium grantii DSM 8605 TaxID=1121316 RepID=A0A1M5SYD8_9CLOT|nr:phosphate propanoyltransferase [Clostridium grantii]SHH43203.1 putative phosphotransacetylase [Clostridium grantii DSM 8605]